MSRKNAEIVAATSVSGARGDGMQGFEHDDRRQTGPPS